MLWSKRKCHHFFRFPGLFLQLTQNEMTCLMTQRLYEKCFRNKSSSLIKADCRPEKRCFQIVSHKQQFHRFGLKRREALACRRLHAPIKIPDFFHLTTTHCLSCFIIPKCSVLTTLTIWTHDSQQVCAWEKAHHFEGVSVWANICQQARKHKYDLRVRLYPHNSGRFEMLGSNGKSGNESRLSH